jgi:hypothetical protein
MQLGIMAAQSFSEKIGLALAPISEPFGLPPWEWRGSSSPLNALISTLHSQGGSPRPSFPRCDAG